jgi:hypothetical protein
LRELFKDRFTQKQEPAFRAQRYFMELDDPFQPTPLALEQHFLKEGKTLTLEEAIQISEPRFRGIDRVVWNTVFDHTGSFRHFREMETGREVDIAKNSYTVSSTPLDWMQLQRDGPLEQWFMIKCSAEHDTKRYAVLLGGFHLDSQRSRNSMQHGDFE